MILQMLSYTSGLWEIALQIRKNIIQYILSIDKRKAHFFLFYNGAAVSNFVQSCCK